MPTRNCQVRRSVRNNVFNRQETKSGMRPSRVATALACRARHAQVTATVMRRCAGRLPHASHSPAASTLTTSTEASSGIVKPIESPQLSRLWYPAQSVGALPARGSEWETGEEMGV